MGNVDYEAAEAGIHQLMADYFEVMYSQNMELFDQVFHPDCTLYGVVDGNPNLRPYEVYRNQVSARQSPAELGESRYGIVLDFDQLSPKIALVKPELTMFGGLMHDYLNIVKLDDKWWVMAKMWDRVGDA